VDLGHADVLKTRTMPDWIGNFDDRLGVEPPLSDEQLARVPARRGVVAMLAEDDRPILLMTAGDIRARVRTRLQERDENTSRKSADLRQITRSVLWKLAYSHFETDLRFLALCRSIWPAKYAAMLGWKPAWFVHVNAADDYPHFSATRKVFASRGRYLGPFSGERAAQRFIDAVHDGFDLCRDYRCLRQSPNAECCAYGQMGRCLRPCDGTISMEEYRRAVAEADAFGAGARDDLRGRLQGRMRAAAEKLQFELAGRIKARLQRLSELDSPEFEHARPAEEFQFILVERSDSRRRAKVFLVDRGRIAEPPPLAYPPQANEIESVLAEMARLAASPRQCGEEEPWVIGLASRYLFSSERMKGLMVRWRAQLGAEALAARIEDARELLSLREPRRRPAKPPGKSRG